VVVVDLGVWHLGTYFNFQCIFYDCWLLDRNFVFGKSQVAIWQFCHLQPYPPSTPPLKPTFKKAKKKKGKRGGTW